MPDGDAFFTAQVVLNHVEPHPILIVLKPPDQDVDGNASQKRVRGVQVRGQQITSEMPDFIPPKGMTEFIEKRGTRERGEFSEKPTGPGRHES